ncbi:MAG: recombinase family protein [Bacteroidia bacterium]|nr:recombinase family protein [Bacteroidia bacterium]
MNPLLQQFAKRDASAYRLQTGTCVIYTRVSTKEQADTNMSLATQLKACEAYAEKHGLTVLGRFGGTYESAKNDERKEFRRMLDFVKKARQKVSYIIVYSVDRFSRSGANAIYIAAELKTQGILVQAVTQPADTATPSGSLQQNIQFIFSEYDNQLRREKIIAGTRDALRRGEFPHKPPRGYMSVTRTGKRVIEFSVEAPLIRQAFEWKAEGLTNALICDRLKARGLTILHQKLAELFENPFYCGLLAHKMLDGEVLKGKHPPLVTEELFLKVNRIAQEIPRGWRINACNGLYPLKGFVRDLASQKPLVGYEVKRKRLHYYKANGSGAKLNRRIERMHSLFQEYLGELTLDPRCIAPLKELLVAAFYELNAASIHTSVELKRQKGALEAKLDKLEVRFMEGEFSKALFDKYSASYRQELIAVEQEIEQASIDLSNLPQVLDKGLKIAASLPELWLLADYETRVKLQYLVYPDGIFFDGKTDRYRTTRVNEIFRLIASLSRSYTENKNGNLRCEIENSRQVVMEVPPITVF